ncbi:MAG: hypothetical protein PGN20_15335 [Agrobacterium cavarae]
MMQSILDRLMEPGTPFAMCGNAGDLADVTDRPNTLPAVFVYMSREASEPNEQINIIRQRTAVDIAVVYVTENLSEDNNGAAAGDIEILKTFARNKLLGFLPTGFADPLEHVEGEMQQALAGAVWFEDVFTGAYYLEKRP